MFEKTMVIVDLRDEKCIPSHGQVSTKLELSENNTILTLSYADMDLLAFGFVGSSQVTRSAFPGPHSGSGAFSKTSFDRLVRLGYSKLATEWTSHWLQKSNRLGKTFHYQLVLPEANEMFDIFARDVEILRDLTRS